MVSSSPRYTHCVGQFFCWRCRGSLHRTRKLAQLCSNERTMLPQLRSISRYCDSGHHVTQQSAIAGWNTLRKPKFAGVYRG